MAKIVLQNCAGLLSKLVGELEFEHNAMWYGDDIFTTRTVRQGCCKKFTKF